MQRFILSSVLALLMGLSQLPPALAQFGGEGKIKGKSGGTATVTNDRLDVNVLGASASGMEVIQDTAADLNAQVTQEPSTDFDVEGTIAENAASTSKPVHFGGIAETEIPTEAADGEAIGIFLDAFGRLISAAFNFGVGADDVNVVAGVPVDSGQIQLIDTILDLDPETITSSAIFIGDKRNITILTKTLETDAGGDKDVQVDWYVELSPDNSEWVICDVAQSDSGSAAPEADGRHNVDPGNGVTIEEVFYLPAGVTGQYLRLTADAETPGDTDADETATVDGWIMWQK